jgi:heme/copper-type cytochrome/quinol oxidase subunit 4
LSADIKTGDIMADNNNSKKLVNTKKKVIMYASGLAGILLFLFMRHNQNGRLGTLDYICAAITAVIAFATISLVTWHANRP